MIENKTVVLLSISINIEMAEAPPRRRPAGGARSSRTLAIISLVVAIKKDYDIFQRI
jgi:hypothetical protein